MNDEYLKKLEPLLQRHKGNLSAAVREVIDLADAVIHDPDSVKRLISGLKKEQNLTSVTLNWALKNLAGRLPDDDTVHNIIGEGVSTISSLEKRLNDIGKEIYFDTSFKISSDDDRMPENATITISGKSLDMNRFLAAVTAMFISKKYNLGISNIRTLNRTLEMNMKRGESEWAFKTIIDSFGYMDCAYSELSKKSDFWNTLINLNIKMNYETVLISKYFFDDLLCGKTSPKITTCFERFFGRPINQIPLEDFIKKMKVLYPSMGIVDRIETDKDSIIVHHGLSNPEAIKRLANIFVELLRLNGHTYSPVVDENLIVLKHLPEVGRILIRMMDDLKTQEIPFVNYSTYFDRMLNVLRSVPYDEDFIKSTGCKFGKIIIQTYEKNNKIDTWDANTFEKYMRETKTIHTHDSKWEMVDRELLYGKLMSCPHAKNSRDMSCCTFMQGILDCSLSHAFGEQTERIYKIQNQLKDKSVFCEIYVALTPSRDRHITEFL